MIDEHNNRLIIEAGRAVFGREPDLVNDQHTFVSVAWLNPPAGKTAEVIARLNQHNAKWSIVDYGTYRGTTPAFIVRYDTPFPLTAILEAMKEENSGTD